MHETLLATELSKHNEGLKEDTCAVGSVVSHFLHEHHFTVIQT